MSNTRRDDVDRFLEYGLSIPTKTYHLNDPIDPESSKQAVRSLMQLDKKDPDTEIKLLINTPGGCEVSGMAIFDTILGCSSDVHGVVLGEACSMGSIILQACDYRLISPNSFIMLHYGTMEHPDDHPENWYRWTEHCKKYCTDMENIYLEKIREKKPSFTRKQLRQMIMFDRILYPKQALEYGLVDEILGE